MHAKSNQSNLERLRENKASIAAAPFAAAPHCGIHNHIHISPRLLTRAGFRTWERGKIYNIIVFCILRSWLKSRFSCVFRADVRFRSQLRLLLLSFPFRNHEKWEAKCFPPPPPPVGCCRLIQEILKMFFSLLLNLLLLDWLQSTMRRGPRARLGVQPGV